MMMFSTLPRYFARTFFLWFSIFAIGITTIIMLFDFSELLRRSSTRDNVTVDIVTQMTILKMPHLLEMLLPFIVLFSAMFALWRLNRQSEICVSRAAGLSIWQLLSPFIWVALLIGFFDLFVVNSFSSNMFSQYKTMNEELLRKKAGGISISKTGIWLRYASETGPIVLRVGHINVEKKILSKVTILEYNDTDNLLVRIDSETASFVPDGLQLNKVWIYPYGASPEFHEELPYHTTLSLGHIQDNKRDPETISFWELPAFIDLLDESGLSSVKYKLYFQGLIARALWLIAMVLLAATCALRPIRQGKQFLFILPTALIGFSLYFLRDITYAMGQSSTLPVSLAAWTPVAVSAMIGLVTLLHLEEH
jgi:lipopolysaccharide export system permease protein